MQHPYTRLPARSFWRTAVAERDPAEIDGLWTPKFAIGQDDSVVTAGSCFAARACTGTTQNSRRRV